ncbi:MAG TPA: hypothetical protein VJ302_36435 [Blastocatellia bacterium]|nr:hypothetical protein [Blastocatellia bacterium]
MSHPRSERLPGKLFQIRAALGLTLGALVGRLGLDELTDQDVDDYERGQRDPPSLVVLAYAKLAGVCTDMLIDDSQDLPELSDGADSRTDLFQ